MSKIHNISFINKPAITFPSFTEYHNMDEKRILIVISYDRLTDARVSWSCHNIRGKKKETHGWYYCLLSSQRKMEFFITIGSYGSHLYRVRKMDRF